MSLEQFDDSEFLTHLAWLVSEGWRCGPEVVTRLLRIADMGQATPEAIIEARHAGINEGRTAERVALTTTSHFPGDDLDVREVSEAPIIVVMSRRAADEASAGLSDLLCWCRGFVAATPEDLERHPLHWEVAREVRIALQRAIEATE